MDSSWKTVDDSSLLSFFTAKKKKEAAFFPFPPPPHPNHFPQNPPMNDHILVWSPPIRINHKQKKDKNNNLWALKIALKPIGHSCNAVHSLFFLLFGLFFYFLTWDVYSERKTSLYVIVYRATCRRDISLWGSKPAPLMHSHNGTPLQSLRGERWNA